MSNEIESIYFDILEPDQIKKLSTNNVSPNILNAALKIIDYDALKCRQILKEDSSYDFNAIKKLANSYKEYQKEETKE